MSDLPVAGLYKTRLVRNGPFVPVKIWHGPPVDPVTGEELDRSHWWRALRGGELIAATEVWPHCGRWPITDAEYRYMLANAEWAKTNAPNEPAARPYKPIDLATMPPLF